jgi:hypothetical protein
MTLLRRKKSRMNINNASAEALTSRRIISSGTYIPPAEVTTS